MSTPARPAPPRRPDASMSLLIEAAMNPVDPAYAEAAARRRPPRRANPGASAVVVLLAVLLGLGTVWAARELRAPRPEVLRARDLLESQVEQRNAEAQALADANAALGAEVDALSAGALAGGGEAVVEALLTQGASVGTVAVRGPGLAVTLSDSLRAQSGAEDAADERVQDLDLQILANGLWAAGAEAIAINGQRLTAVSAIRSAGEAILVDLIPLIGPYEVDAVGDPETMRTELARTTAASHLALLRDTYDIGVQIVPSDGLELPASPVPTLRYATPAGGTGVAPGGPDVPGSGQTQGESP